MNSFHPEDRLLRLIKGEKKEQKGSGKFMKFSGCSDRLKQAISILKTKPVISINQTLYVIISMLLIYTAYIWMRSGTSEEILIPSSRVLSLESIEEKPQIDLKNQNLKSASFYSEMARKRNLFKQLITNPVILPEARISIRQLVKDFKLIGIVLDERTQVIIENRITKSVHYVNEGNTVGELKVSKISESSVTLSYGTETIDLFL